MGSDGISVSVAGHFGEFLQGRLGADGPVVLVTLPCPDAVTQVTWRPGPGFGLYQHGVPVLSREDVRWLFRLLVGQRPSGIFRVRSGMPPGGGAGASTAARLGLIRAMAEPLGGLWPEIEAILCVAMEGASDPLMHERPERMLWASRLGQVVERLPALPAFEVVGGFDGPGRRTDAGDAEFADVSDLVARWMAACGDRREIAEIASASAMRNHMVRGGRNPGRILTLARDLGAIGIAAGHTGSARAMLFEPGRVPDGAASALRAAGLSGVRRFRVGGKG